MDIFLATQQNCGYIAKMVIKRGRSFQKLIFVLEFN